MPTSRRTFLKSVSAAVGAASLSAAGLGEETGSGTGTGAGIDTSTGNEKLWYTKPAAEWLEALPIGNGRISAMVFGGTDHERLQLNEGTLWAGGPHDYTSPDGLAALPEIRRLVFAEKWHEAQQLVDAKFMGRPAGQMPYQTVGDLLLNFTNPEPVTNYRRELDLTTAIATTIPVKCSPVRRTT
jgi:alpha-L-fucosidase 2